MKPAALIKLWKFFLLYRENKRFMAKMAIYSNKKPQPYDSLKSAVAIVPLPHEKSSGKLWKMRRFRSQQPRISSHWTKKEETKLWNKMFEEPDCDVALKK